MSFLNGLMLIDCTASALNNANDKIEGARTDNTASTKVIKTKEGKYPYMSAQAFRYIWRNISSINPLWKNSPIFRENKIAYTDANPIEYFDDDLFGYMRAESKKIEKTEEINKTPTSSTLTRKSPLSVSTLVSIAPIKEITSDFGVMARHEGDPVPYEHEFYKTVLKGLFNLDLRMSGRFYFEDKTGFKHLDEVRIKLAEDKKLNKYNDKCYELSIDDRKKRISILLDSLKVLNGGAKQSVHYTDIVPKFMILAVNSSGNNIFSTVIGANDKGLPVINIPALEETIRVYSKNIQSKIYIGLTKGFMDEQRSSLEEVAKNNSNVIIKHPAEIIDDFIKDMDKEGLEWLK